MRKSIIFIILAIIAVSCNQTGKGNKNTNDKNTMKKDSTKLYGFNREFLKDHVNILELKRGNAAVLIVPSWQGRVMTSTADGDGGFSFGWINHKLISSREIVPHINPFGGEERLWLGPEGGQFSIFFSKGKEFVYENWQTPAFLDTEAFRVESAGDTSALFSHDAEIVNYSGTPLKLRIEREVTMLSEKEIAAVTGITTPEVRCVGYRSGNRLINKGEKEWKKETGLLSVWMLGMFTPSPSVIVVIPYVKGDEKVYGKAVNDNYFGKIAADRLRVTDSHVFFRADGKSRGKIGIPPLRAAGKMGSYDSENNVLTLLISQMAEGVTDYVNSAWQIQEYPFAGDVLNSYNDGPLEDGSQMGPFYELETSSPAAALKPGESILHSQVTIHFTGPKEQLNNISVKTLGVSLENIESAFEKVK